MKYQPINCSLYDRIESLAIGKKYIEIIYSDDKENKTIFGKIENIYSKEKAEFLRINSIEIRLDQIKTISERLDLV